MSLILQETKVKTILCRSGIPDVDYCINPYIGCFHGCTYCYATFMKRFTGHTENWGSFLDIKTNAPVVLQRQLKRALSGNIMISSVTDPYQPVEDKYKLTRQCLEVLLEYQFPIDILTKSPLVQRDIDLFKKFRDIKVGITITTDNERIRKIFEPKAPPISTRINALKKLHDKGVNTYAFIGPVLPMNPEVITEGVLPFVEGIRIDRMNYISKSLKIYNRMNLNRWLDKDFIDTIIENLKKGFSGKDVSVC